ncbi:MAG TPA: hypothetical protein VMH01_10760 [Puia sp.]|nr:hypothetical protein [Puia sp.]
MKKQVLSAISKMTMGALLLTGLSISSVKAGSVISGDRAVVKYLGTAPDAILFRVSVDNPSGNKFSVIILDETGNEIFREVYTDKNFEKRFRLPKSDEQKLTFVIRDYKGADIKQAFSINTNYVEDINVTKL